MGATFTWAGSLDFSVNFVDPCLTQALVTAPVQSNPADYLYDFSATSEFILTPFVISPAFCVPVYSCSGISGPRTDMCQLMFIDSLGRITTGFFDINTGKHTFSSTDKTNFPPGIYEFQI